MQRRAAAAAAVIFLLLAVGAYAYLGMATKPAIQTTVAAEGSVNESVTLGGQSYTIDSITAIAGGQATLQWFNDSYQYTETIANGSNVTYDSDIPETDWDDTNLTYQVTIPNTSTPTTATFTEVQTTNRSTFTEDGTTYVLVDQDGDGTREAVPAEEYFGEPREFTVQTDGSLTYHNNSTTVASISTSELTLTWIAPNTLSETVGVGGNITLPTGTYLAYFQDTDPASEGPDVVILTQDFDGYETSLERQAYWTERMKGLWGVVAIGILAGLGLLSMAYLPPRY